MSINKQKALDTAQKFLQKGQIDKAILEYRKVCEADPEDLRALQKLGDLFARQGSRQEAINTFMKLAEMLTTRGFGNRAVSIYKQILQLNPLLVPVYVRLSDLFQDLGLSKDARIFNQRAIEILQKTGKQDELLSLLKKVVEADPDDAICRITLAEAFLKQGNTAGAVHELEAVLPLLREQKLDELFIRAAERLLYHNPENVALCRELAVLHMKRNEIPRAMKLLLFCRKKDPEDVEAMELLAYHFISTGVVNKATMVLHEKAKVHRKRAETPLVIQTYRKIIELDPSDVEARRALREIAPEELKAEPSAETEIPIFEDSGVEGAAQAARAPSERPPTPPPPPPERVAPGLAAESVVDPVAVKFIEEADVFLKYGLVDKAVEHLKMGLERTPMSLEIHEKLKDVFLDRSDLDQAVKVMFRLAEISSGKDPASAAGYLKEILLIDPRQPQARALLQALDSSVSLPPLDEEPVLLRDADRLEEVEPIPAVTPAARVQEGSGPLDGGEYASFLDEETSDALVPLPALEGWEVESSQEEAARLLDSVTLPELELGDIDALETETDEVATADLDRLSSQEIVLEPSPAEPVPAPPSLTSGELDELFPALDAAPPAPPEPPPEPPAARPAAMPAAARISSTAVEDALEETEFFIQQGLRQEAVLFLEDLLRNYPGNRLIQDKLDDLARGSGRPVEEISPVFKAPDLFSLSSPAIPVPGSDSQATDEAIDALNAIESIIREGGSADDSAPGTHPSEIDPSDARTHYDLGAAYMEMEVWESAIQEFRAAAGAPQMEAACYNMIGNCMMKMGRPEDAIKEYKMGLFSQLQNQEQELNLYYDIAEAYLKLDDQREAIYYLQNIKKKDVSFKDVKLKIVALTSSYKPAARSSTVPAKTRKPTPSADAGQASKEVDAAFDDLFGDFGKEE